MNQPLVFKTKSDFLQAAFDQVSKAVILKSLPVYALDVMGFCVRD